MGATYCDTLHRQVIIAPFKSLINVQPLMYYTLQLSSLKYCIQLHASSNKLLYGLIILLTQKVRLSPALLCSLVPWVPHFFALVVTAVSLALPSSHISFSLHVSLCRPTPALLHPKTRNLSTHNSSAKCKHTCDISQPFSRSRNQQKHEQHHNLSAAHHYSHSTHIHAHTVPLSHTRYTPSHAICKSKQYTSTACISLQHNSHHSHNPTHTSPHSHCILKRGHEACRNLSHFFKSSYDHISRLKYIRTIHTWREIMFLLPKTAYTYIRIALLVSILKRGSQYTPEITSNEIIKPTHFPTLFTTTSTINNTHPHFHIMLEPCITQCNRHTYSSASMLTRTKPLNKLTKACVPQATTTAFQPNLFSNCSMPLNLVSQSVFCATHIHDYTGLFSHTRHTPSQTTCNNQYTTACMSMQRNPHHSRDFTHTNPHSHCYSQYTSETTSNIWKYTHFLCNAYP
jgi:hypothetical protein